MGLVKSTAPATLARSTVDYATKPSPESMFPGSDFYTLSEPKLQTNCLIAGESGCGKTSFVTLFCPAPIAMINFDRRASDAVYRAEQSGKRILYADVAYPHNAMELDDKESMRVGEACVGKVVRNLEYAVKESIAGNIRTICLDTGTELGEIINMATAGRPDKSKYGDRGKSKDLANRQWGGIYDLVRDGLAHFVVLSRAKEIWIDDKGTGRYTYRGSPAMFEGVEWAGVLKAEKTSTLRLGGGLVLGGANATPADGKIVRSIHMIKAGVNGGELGQTYTEAQWEGFGGPFAFCAMMQYMGRFPGSSPEDWLK